MSRSSTKAVRRRPCRTGAPNHPRAGRGRHAASETVRRASPTRSAVCNRGTPYVADCRLQGRPAARRMRLPHRARREILHADPRSQLKLRPRSRERRLCGEGRRQPTPVGGSSPPSFPGDEPPSSPGKLFLATSSPSSWRGRASNLAGTRSPSGVRQGAVPERTRPRRTREVAYPPPSAPRRTGAR
jgi:hypothetical protein